MGKSGFWGSLDLHSCIFPAFPWACGPWLLCALHGKLNCASFDTGGVPLGCGVWLWEAKK